MIDFLGTIVTAALMVVVVNALVVYLEIGRSAKLVLAGAAGLWSDLRPPRPRPAGSRFRTPFRS
jgi:hypothetical protein